MNCRNISTCSNLFTTLLRCRFALWICKYIFLISQGGSESAYVINLLLQLGYDGNLLYNVGGVSNSEGPTPYKDVEGNKYYVEGHSGFNPSVSYDFVSDLTPIN